MNAFPAQVEALLELEYQTTPEQADVKQLYEAVSRAALDRVMERWNTAPGGKRAAYFSAEFLIGRVVYANLLNMGLLDSCGAWMQAHGIDPAVFEQIEDAALGNGGLGRLAACFLDSAATKGVPLDGYGIRYRYGLFRQSFQDGFQLEAADDWQRFGDPWSLRREAERVTVCYKDQTVYAVPYDMPVIGYGAHTVNTLRLWQAEPICGFDFALFNAQKYDAAVKERNEAETISSVLYPNDDTDKGKKLRLKQEYFFTSASLQDILRRDKAASGGDFAHFADRHAIQLNDTHPVLAIPEFIRLLSEGEGVAFDKALAIARDTFAYTNHTIMPEALETWSVKLLRAVIPAVYRVIVRIDRALCKELAHKGITGEQQDGYRIVAGDTVHMARLAIFATHSVNGVARLHTDILKTSALKAWHELYPGRFNNKTNGITQRRWLLLANRELSSLISGRIGDGWITDLDELKRLEPLADDAAFRNDFMHVKRTKKEELARYVAARDGVTLDPDFLFDVQVKRLHEYKRQLLNAFAVLDTFYGLKEGRITAFTPTLYLFGAKAAPGYYRAKGIIKYIHEVGRLIAGDPAMRGRMQVVFVTNYDVSYAEKIIPAADVSEQISTAGTEASGTSNMKFMLNGAVTLGTYDGANVEIVERAGEENNYIFGARVEDIARLREGYDPRRLYEADPRLKRVVDSLIDGTLDDGGSGMFRELYTALLDGASWHAPDHYFLLADFPAYCAARLRANNDYAARLDFSRKCVHNIANAGPFSSDRTILEYAREIWNV